MEPMGTNKTNDAKKNSRASEKFCGAFSKGGRRPHPIRVS